MTIVRSLPTVPTGDRYDAESKVTHKGMAHFAGTGPVGAYCATCTHYRKRPHSTRFVCWNFRYLSRFGSTGFVRLMARGTSNPDVSWEDLSEDERITINRVHGPVCSNMRRIAA